MEDESNYLLSEQADDITIILLYFGVWMPVSRGIRSPKAIRGTNKSTPGPKLPVERIRGTKQIYLPIA